MQSCLVSQVGSANLPSFTSNKLQTVREAGGRPTRWASLEQQGFVAEKSPFLSEHSQERTNDPDRGHDEGEGGSVDVSLECGVEGSGSVAVQVGGVADQDDEGAHHFLLHHRTRLLQHLRRRKEEI